MLWLLIAGGLLLLLPPFLPIDARNYLLQVLIFLYINIVLAQSYDILGGQMGYINLGHITFFGLGAYGLGVFYLRGVPFLVGLPLSVLLVMLFAALISVPFFRLRGAYFSLAAFSMVKLVELFVINLGDLTGGSNGLKIDPADRNVAMYFICLALVLLMALTAWLVTRSRFGLALRSIREDEDVARDFGVPTVWIKTRAMVLSSFFPALLGGAYTWYINFIDPEQVFGLKIALTPVAMAMLGGSGLIAGPIVGAIILYGAEQLFLTQLDHLHGAFLGLVIVLVGQFMPGGVMRLGLVRRGLARLGWESDHP